MRPELRRELDEIVWVDAGRMSGAPCFGGTRIFVQMLIDHLSDGFSLDEFPETAPTLDRELAKRFIFSEMRDAVRQSKPGHVRVLHIR
jgi:uncharacterized protein (DUF433 family)